VVLKSRTKYGGVLRSDITTMLQARWAGSGDHGYWGAEEQKTRLSHSGCTGSPLAVDCRGKGRLIGQSLFQKLDPSQFGGSFPRQVGVHSGPLPSRDEVILQFLLPSCRERICPSTWRRHSRDFWRPARDALTSAGNACVAQRSFLLAPD